MGGAGFFAGRLFAGKTANKKSRGTVMMYRTILPFVMAAMLAAAPAAADEDKLKTDADQAKIQSPARPETPVAKPIAIAKVDDKAEAAPAEAAASNAPVNGRIIHQADSGKLCIGGVLCSKFCETKPQDCEPTPSLTIKLDKPARINTIQLSAHDNIGATRRSRLVVKVNGKPVANTLVYRLGSTLSIDVGETGELITIESAHQYNGFLRGGEEAVIWDVYVFGENQS
jgi:hypothetical protein